MSLWYRISPGKVFSRTWRQGKFKERTCYKSGSFDCTRCYQQIKTIHTFQVHIFIFNPYSVLWHDYRSCLEWSIQKRNSSESTTMLYSGTPCQTPLLKSCHPSQNLSLPFGAVQAFLGADNYSCRRWLEHTRRILKSTFFFFFLKNLVWTRLQSMANILKINSCENNSFHPFPSQLVRSSPSAHCTKSSKFSVCSAEMKYKLHKKVNFVVDCLPAKWNQRPQSNTEFNSLKPTDFKYS